MPSNIRWGRIILAAFLLEVAITAVALPVGAIFGNPMQGTGGGATVFYVTVALACFVWGVVFGAWAARPLISGHAFQGLLVGLVAMAMYFGLCSLAPGGLAGVIAGYGLTMFVAFNALRTLGCVAGAAYWSGRTSRSARLPTA